MELNCAQQLLQQQQQPWQLTFVLISLNSVNTPVDFVKVCSHQPVLTDTKKFVHTEATTWSQFLDKSFFLSEA